MLKGKDRAAASGPRICLLLPVFGPRDTPSSSLPPPSNLFPSRNLRDHLPGHPPPLGPASAFLRLAPYRPPTLVPSSSEPSPGGASHPLLPAPAPTCSVPISTATTGLLRARAASPAGSLRSSTAPILWGERKASAQLRPLPACTGLGGGGDALAGQPPGPGSPRPPSTTCGRDSWAPSHLLTSGNTTSCVGREPHEEDGDHLTHPLHEAPALARWPSRRPSASAWRQGLLPGPLPAGPRWLLNT